MNVKFPQQEKILYCFKLIEGSDDNFKLVKYCISEYEKHSFSPYRTDYRFEGKFIGDSYGIDSIKEDKIGRVANKKYFTFDPSQEKAEEAFSNYFIGLVVDARTKLESSMRKFDMWGRRDVK